MSHRRHFTSALFVRIRALHWLGAVFVLGAVPFSRGAENDLPAITAAALQRPGVEITALEFLPAGSFAPPEGGATLEELPAFCRIAATLRTTPESHIRIEVWLPRENWNGRLLGTGNGGSAGRILYNYLAMGVKRGFATVNTDLGTSPNVEGLAHSPERWRDFGYRATHEMTVVARQWATAFYGRSPQRAYFVGGSTGGQQALMAAQRFPEDYDGILAHKPANNRTLLHHNHLWNWRALNETPDSRLTAEQIAWVNRAVVAANVGK
ncbi:MAG TPA: tannase/feruloyl esterase family alpha/beta hydrolase, partial [Lacunisphaera sp.]|nr:tannase/feruloyl esterase family alpha/beta hydrolase [Lacunisphaera sp.]